ncbi:MAG: YARHG domain-containing protein [Fulvivirga sp.]|uniref:YARHG domain-containing protein n=1 Tax=Fulvivirga sp. TaxID=1931237 RepID=UPI0032EE22F7
MNKRYSIIYILFIIAGCSGQPDKESRSAHLDKTVKEKKKPDSSFYHVELDLNEPEIQVNYQEMDSTVRDQISRLDSGYKSTPYYADIDGLKFFVVSTGKWDYNVEEFSGELKYGMVNDSLHLILPLEYDKIYNPNLTVKESFELKKDSRVGLFNYVSGEIITPQFDFILPQSSKISEVAYGYKNNSWYELKDGKIERATFDPTTVLQQLKFDVVRLGSNMMYDSYYISHKNDPTLGRGVVITPSYIEYLGLSQREFYPDVIITNQENVDFGLESAGTRTNSSKSISDRIMTFFISFYESGIDARDYSISTTQLVVYQKDNNTLTSEKVVSHSGYNELCAEANYRFVNDSILEIIRGKSIYDYPKSESIYDHQTSYSYKKLLHDGSIIELKSDREFDFTKFVFIDKSYFEGCFIDAIDYEKETGYNILVADHLSIHDLDVMRNEIFAEYGYKFKSAEWATYFSSMPWYKPLYDDVTDKLTEIDKANIKVILDTRELMIGREEEFTNKRKSVFYAAG